MATNDNTAVLFRRKAFGTCVASMPFHCRSHFDPLDCAYLFKRVTPDNKSVGLRRPYDWLFFLGHGFSIARIASGSTLCAVVWCGEFHSCQRRRIGPQGMPFFPSLREAAGRGRGWGVSPRIQLAVSLLKHPPPPTPPCHALRAREEGRRSGSVQQAPLQHG
jgi:hypothetical protein